MSQGGIDSIGSLGGELAFLGGFSGGAQAVLQVEQAANDKKQALAIRLGFGVLLGVGTKIVAHFALRAGHEVEIAAERMAADIDDFFIRHDVATEAVGRQGTAWGPARIVMSYPGAQPV